MPANAIPWTPERTALLRKEYPTAPDLVALADRLGCSVNAMCLKARSCGLARPRAKLWTPKLDAVVRRLRGRGHTHADIAARLGLTVLALRNRAPKIGVRTRVNYTAAEDAKLRDMFWTHSSREMAAAIGRPLEGVLGRLQLLGLKGKFRSWPPAVLKRVKALNRAGKCDREIAEAMPETFPPGPDGCSRVAYLRRRHGLPYHRDMDAHRRSIEAQRKTLGIRTMHDLRQLGWDKRAAAYGLPPGLRRRATQILIALLDGPATRRQLGDRIGAKSDSRKGPLKRTRYLAELEAMGLVCRVRRHMKGHRQGGRLDDLFMLTLRAAELLATAARQGDPR